MLKLSNGPAMWVSTKCSQPRQWLECCQEDTDAFVNLNLSVTKPTLVGDEMGISQNYVKSSIYVISFDLIFLAD